MLLLADSLANYNCINGFNNSVFGQFAYCNSVNFFSRVNMPLLYTLNNTDNLDYCNNIAPSFYKKYGPEFVVFNSPDPNVANNLLNFLVFRFINSWTILKCDVLTGKKVLFRL